MMDSAGRIDRRRGRTGDSWSSPWQACREPAEGEKIGEDATSRLPPASSSYPLPTSPWKGEASGTHSQRSQEKELLT